MEMILPRFLTCTRQADGGEGTRQAGGGEGTVVSVGCVSDT